MANSVIFVLLLCIVAPCFALEPGMVKYEDLRCKCTCSSYHNVPAKVYKNNTLHDDCNCLSVVVPKLKGTTIKEEDVDPYCYLCECKYEVRSTKTMQVVVYIFLVVVSLLVVYMIFMMIIDLITNCCSDGSNKGRHQPLRDDVTELSEAGGRDADRNSVGGRSSVFQRVNMVQAKWKRQVQEQQSNVFDKQDILN